MTEIKILKTPELVEKLKPFWNEMQNAEDEFRMEISEIESRMWDSTKIEGIEFFFSDGEVVGIGNYNRSMELIRASELDE